MYKKVSTTTTTYYIYTYEFHHDQHQLETLPLESRSLCGPLLCERLSSAGRE
jgi:hypothetical protein